MTSARTVRVNLRSLWTSLRTSFWFVPTLMVLGAVGLAYLLTAVDARVEDPREVLPSWLIAASPDNARQLLATVGGSMITIAGVSFSVVIVALVKVGSRVVNRVKAALAEAGVDLPEPIYRLAGGGPGRVGGGGRWWDGASRERTAIGTEGRGDRPRARWHGPCQILMQET